MAVMVVGVWGQLQATPSCAASLVPCQQYLGSDNPPESCCGPMRKTVQEQLPCLCNLFKSPEIFKAFNINITQALALPVHCGVSNNTSICSALAPGASATPESKNAVHRAAWIGWSGTMSLFLLMWSILV